jgi:DNA-binding NarL/FixJ family response regulator
MKHKLYIVEDHDDMRLLFKRMIRKKLPEIEIVGESATGEMALEEIPQMHPDIVMVDISLPGMDGIELIKLLKSKCNNLCILIITGHDTDRYLQAATEAGAHGIVSKSEGLQLIQKIRELLGKKNRNNCD